MILIFYELIEGPANIYWIRLLAQKAYTRSFISLTDIQWHLVLRDCIKSITRKNGHEYEYIPYSLQLVEHKNRNQKSRQSFSIEK